MEQKPLPTRAMIERVRAYLQLTGAARTKLALCAGLSESALRGIESDDWNPTLRTLEAVWLEVEERFEALRRGAETENVAV